MDGWVGWGSSGARALRESLFCCLLIKKDRQQTQGARAVHRAARSRRAACVVWCAHGMETAAEVPVETLLCAVVAHAGAALGARDVASTAAVSRACRAAVGPHGVVRAALGSRDAGERVKGCKVVVAARVRAGEDEDEGEAASGAAL